MFYSFPKSMQVRILKNFFTYTYLIYDMVSRQAVLVDPAWDISVIKRFLAEFKLQGILLTHHHFDHVNLADQLARESQVPVFLPREEIDFYDFHCHNLQGIGEEKSFAVGSFDVKPWLTPGHTRCGCCFQLGSNLFTGDTVFIEGCGMCNLDGGSPYAMFNSLEKLKKYIAPEVLIYPGHSYGAAPGKAFAYLLQNNIYFNFSDCESFVSFRMRKHQKGLFNFK